ncbi:MAG: peptide chain release factor N(5)-glutamine methyltransferase [Patescibacteria group bacterium]|nr:peptide chain release factor N(5)-glutamine methyltransferase [Patescibacteria group bacterium]
MNISDAINEGVSVLGGKKISRLSCELLLAYTLRKNREYIFSRGETKVSDEQFEEFLRLVDANAKGEPIAYLTGLKEFYGIPFYVDKNVLIPRPETEMLVDEALKYIPGNGNFLDIGTGSGAIAVSVLKTRSDVEGVAADIFAEALVVAYHNSVGNGVNDRLTLIKSDLLEDLKGDFDVICTNLPYIGSETFVNEDVKKHEPAHALYAGEGGLELYKKLFQQLGKKVTFKVLIGEFGYDQGNSIGKLLNKFFDQRWEIKKDLQGISRIFVVSV